jgi:hypothetical protein
MKAYTGKFGKNYTGMFRAQVVVAAGGFPFFPVHQRKILPEKISAR